jgi:hypothetical protein
LKRAVAQLERMKRGECPIYELGLPDMLPPNIAEGRLRFTTSLPEAMEDAEVIFIAVGTPPGEDGSADLRHVLAVADGIGRAAVWVAVPLASVLHECRHPFPRHLRSRPIDEMTGRNVSRAGVA